MRELEKIPQQNRFKEQVQTDNWETTTGSVEKKERQGGSWVNVANEKKARRLSIIVEGSAENGRKRTIHLARPHLNCSVEKLINIPHANYDTKRLSYLLHNQLGSMFNGHTADSKIHSL